MGRVAKYPLLLTIPRQDVKVAQQRHPAIMAGDLHRRMLVLALFRWENQDCRHGFSWRYTSPTTRHRSQRSGGSKCPTGGAALAAGVPPVCPISDDAGPGGRDP